MKMSKFSWEKSVPMLATLCLFLLFGLTSCNQDEEIVDDLIEDLTTEELTRISSESEVETSYENLDVMALEAMEMTDETAEKRDLSSANESLLRSAACVTVTHDSIAKTILIDFGTGCVGPDGKTRSGQVLITYTTQLYKPGATLTATLHNYSVDSLDIEGTRRIANVSANLQAPISLKTTLKNGKVTWPDATFATRQASRTRTWIRAAHPSQDQFHVDGGYTGMTRAGDTFTMKIKSTLILKRKCRLQQVNIPVKGLKLFTYSNKPNILIDFGDGVCDSWVTVTKNGKSKLIQL